MSARFILAFALLLGQSSASAAAPVTWAFEGTVRILEMGEASELAGSLGVTLGAPVSGHVRYRDDVFSLGGSAGGVFDGAMLGFGVVIGDFAGGFDSQYGCCFFDVNVDPASGRGSIGMFGIGVGASSLFPLGAPASLSLRADTPGVIADIVHIPLAPPPLGALRPFSIEDWSDPFGSVGTGVEIGFYGWEGGRIVVELTSLALVPEPEPLALLAVAFAAGASLRRRASWPAPRRAASRPRSGPAAEAARPES